MQDPAALRTLVEDDLAQLGYADRLPRSLYAPVSYFLGLGGKRARPVLALLAWQAYSQEPIQGGLPAARALELLHNFTLMHDDIMDEAPTRRGQPSVHAAWDVNTAILSGDVVLVQAVAELAKYGSRTAALLQAFADNARIVCEGQARDMDLETTPQPSLPDYLEMIEQKTAALIGGSLQLGALAAGAPDEEVAALYQYGLQSGVAFQIQDDVLDLYGPADRVGKQPGGDIIQNKKTFLWLRAMELANRYQQETLLNLTQVPDAQEKVARVQEVFDALGMQQEGEKAIRQWAERAQATIQPLLHRPGVQLLHDYLQAVLFRTH